MTPDILCRPAGTGDLPQINAIYNHYVAHSTCVWSTDPCSAAQRQAWFDAHGPDMPMLLAECNGRVVGWAALSSFREAYTVAGTLEDSIYVHHDFHRQGIGRQLLTELLEAARGLGVRSILANISGDQLPSIRLHEKLGFQKVGQFWQVGIKFGRRFDVVFMQLLLADQGP